MKITKEEYTRIRDFIYRKTGLFFEDRKLFFVQKRLEKRVSITGAYDMMSYFRELQFRDPQGTELQNLLNILTTNETYFFREFDQLASFAEHCLEEITENKKKYGHRKLKIWSAGCSTGEEPYTIAIIIREMMDDYDDWIIEIIATDINTRVLNFAKQAVYESRAVKDVPPEYLKRWFTYTNENNYRLSPEIKKMCQFNVLNLMNHTEMKQMFNIDFIFCRNVLIYFDNISRKEVVSHYYDSLNPGGYIFLGHSESMTRISSAFRPRRKGGNIVYQKPE